MPDWNPQAVLGLARNFMESRILLTGAELDLFTLVDGKSLSAKEINERIDGNLRGLTILLDALAAMGLLVKSEGKYTCEPSAAPFLNARSPASVLPMLLHAANLWHRWSNLTALAGGERPAVGQDSWISSFIGAMHAIAAPQAPHIVSLVDPGPARKLIDIGGASGTYTIAFLQASPEMTATLFDRPPVVEMARQRLAEAGLLDRVTLVPSDFYMDPLPGGHDLAFLSAIIHQNSPEQNVDLFRKTFSALEPGGRIVVRDHVLSPDRTQPKSGAIFAVNMLTGTSGGNSYTYEEISSALTEAGFTRVSLTHEDSLMDGLVEAFKPS
ncbi:MAG: hypothetical protein IT210_11190 [Armatimonadetes bacterium]|nr:hypothetical protein [Armatimonadota bacterium]